MAKKTPSLVDDVLARATPGRPGFRTWFERLPEDARAELQAVRERFDPTVHQKRAYALAVIEAVKERGWEISGIQGVIAWLDGKR